MVGTSQHAQPTGTSCTLAPTASRAPTSAAHEEDNSSYLYSFFICLENLSKQVNKSHAELYFIQGNAVQSLHAL